jgi:hypothetical protein
VRTRTSFEYVSSTAFGLSESAFQFEPLSTEEDEPSARAPGAQARVRGARAHEECSESRPPSAASLRAEDSRPSGAVSGRAARSAKRQAAGVGPRGNEEERGRH